MTVTTRRLSTAALTFVAVSLLGAGPSSLALPLPGPLPQDQAVLTAVYQAGQRGDRSVIPSIIALLRRPTAIPADVAMDNHIDPFSQIDPLYIHTALRAAVQLRATETFPDIDKLISSNDADASALARVTKARILAEAATDGIQDSHARAAAKVSRFYRELGFTPERLNGDLSDYNKPPVDKNGQPTTYPADGQPDVPVGVYAMREIADMLYSGDYRDYVSLPGVSPLKMTEDMPSMLKRRFARPTRAERVGALLEDLSRRNPGLTWDPQQDYLMQLAIDEGPFAAAAATGKLQEMEAHPQEYPAHGYYNLIEIVRNTGGVAEASRLEKMHDARRQIAMQYQAGAKAILKGQRKIIVPGY